MTASEAWSIMVTADQRRFRAYASRNRDERARKAYERAVEDSLVAHVQFNKALADANFTANLAA